MIVAMLFWYWSKNVELELTDYACKYIDTWKIYVFCQDFGLLAHSPKIRKAHFFWQDERLVILLFGCIFVLLWQYGNKK